MVCKHHSVLRSPWNLEIKVACKWRTVCHRYHSLQSHVVVTSHHNMITACYCHHSRPAPGTPALPAGEGPPTYRFNVHGWWNSSKKEKTKQLKKLIENVKMDVFWPTSDFYLSAVVSNNNFPTSSRDKEPPLVCRNTPWIKRTFSVFKPSQRWISNVTVLQ